MRISLGREGQGQRRTFQGREKQELRQGGVKASREQTVNSFVGVMIEKGLSKSSGG